MQAFRNMLAFLLAGLAMFGVAPLALAVSPFDPLVAAVSFTDATTAIFSVAAVLVGMSVVISGIVIVWRLVKKSKGS